VGGKKVENSDTSILKEVCTSTEVGKKSPNGEAVVGRAPRLEGSSAVKGNCFDKRVHQGFDTESARSKGAVFDRESLEA